MLRTKYRKIGILALIPRILGSDIRHAPSKLQKLPVNVQRIAEKSTKSNNHDDICEKCRQLIEMSFGPHNETPNTTCQTFKKPESHNIFNPIQDIHKKHMSQSCKPPTDSKNESGQGKHSPADESHQSKHSPAEEVNEGFNLQNDYRNKDFANMRSMNNNESQYLTDEGKQMHFQGNNNESQHLTDEGKQMHFQGNNNESQHLTDEGKQMHFQGNNNESQHLTDEGKQKQNFQGNNNDSQHLTDEGKQMQNFLRNNNESQHLTDEGKQMQNFQMNNNDSQHLTDEGKQMQNFQGGNENYYGNEKPKNEDTQRNSTAETQQHEPNANEIDYWKGYNYPIQSNYQPYTGVNVHFIPPENNTVNATTAKENEEKLTQKQDNIEETPVVETPKVNTEGFNTEPKVLGESYNEHQNYNTYYNSRGKEYGESSRLDNLAKKCLDAPRNEIDERLLKEMNKLGVPQTGHQVTDHAPLMNNELIQMDVWKRPKKPVETTTDLDSESRSYENDPAQYNDIQKLYPTYMSGNQKFQKRMQEGDKKDETVKLKTTKYYPNHDGNISENQLEIAENKSQYDPNQVLIEPYGKRITEAECDDYNNAAVISKYQNIDITQAAPLFPDNVVKDKKENDITRIPLTTSEVLEYKQKFASISNMTSEASEHKQESASIPNTNSEACEYKQNYAIPNMNAGAFEQKQMFAPIPNTNSEACEHKEMSASIPNTNSEACEHKQTLASISNTTSEASEHKQESASIPKAKSKAYKYKQYYAIPNINAEACEHKQTLASISNTTSEDSEHKQKSASISNTISEAYEHKPTSAPISNTNSVEKEQIVNISATREFLEMPKQRAKEPQLLNSSQNPNPEENQLKHKMEGDSSQTTSGELEVSHSYVQQEQIVHPLPNEEPKQRANENVSKNIATPLPVTNINLDQDLSLSELLKRVRHRNRVEYCSSFIVNSSAAPDADPIVGKCGAPKKPPCPPPAPICPKPDPPPPPRCPPPPPRCPRPCKPKCPPSCPPPKKNPCEKYKKTCFGSSFKGLLTFLICTPSTCQLQYAAMLFNCLLRSEKAATSTGNAVLTDEVIESLESVGKILVTVEHQDKLKSLETEMAELGEKGGSVSYVRDYEPWVPIPSWPIEKKEEKRPFICPKEGCKQIPPPPRDPPCNEKPCTHAPKRIFSPIDLFSTLMDENKVNDYREI